MLRVLFGVILASIFGRSSVSVETNVQTFTDELPDDELPEDVGEVAEDYDLLDVDLADGLIDDVSDSLFDDLGGSVLDSFLDC
jgi:hypothetical protein